MFENILFEIFGFKKWNSTDLIIVSQKQALAGITGLTGLWSKQAMV